MPDTQKLKQLSVDNLLQELRAREAKAKNIGLPTPREPKIPIRHPHCQYIGRAPQRCRKGRNE